MISRIKISRLLMLTLLVAFAFISQAISQEPKAPTEPRKIPGITDKDIFTNSCVSCHKNYPDMKYDARLSTVLAAWKEKVTPEILAKAQSIAPEGITLKGKHPYIAKTDDNIPEACNKCHGKTMKTAFTLSKLIHVIHLTGGKDNHFLTMFNGECTHCHKLDLKTGSWSVMNGKEMDEEKK